MNLGQNYYKKVNKFNISFVWLFSVILTIQAFLLTGRERGLLVLLITIIPSVICTILYFLKVNSKITAIAIPLALTVSLTALAFIEKRYSAIVLGYFVIVCLVALYFDSKILLIVLAIIDAIYLFSIFILKISLVGNVELSESLIQIIYLNIGVVFLYFLTKWGGEYVKSAIENKERSDELLNNLEENMKVLEETSVTLDNSISDFRVYVDNLSQTSLVTVQSMNEMSKGTEEEAKAISNVSVRMKEAHEKLQYAYEKSESNEAISNEVSVIATNNRNDINSMEDNMDTINIAVSEGLQTVTDLGNSMEDISQFLTAIEGIASQTNLLALNASIEASRAGEAGRGFEVVATEIRNLSDESNKMVKEISEIVEVTQAKATNAVEVVKNGNQAVSLGVTSLDKINTSMEEMFQSFEKMKENIQDEYKSMNEITGLFEEIEVNIEQSASIMEEHAATTEEVNATLEEQDSHINEMVGIINKIQTLSNELIAKKGQESEENKDLEENQE